MNYNFKHGICGVDSNDNVIWFYSDKKEIPKKRYEEIREGVKKTSTSPKKNMVVKVRVATEEELKEFCVLAETMEK